MKNSSIDALQRWFYAAGLLVAVVAILIGARVVLVPLALGALLAFILTPMVAWLERRRLPRAASVTIVAVLSLVVLTGATYVVTTELGELAWQLREEGSVYQ